MLAFWKNGYETTSVSDLTRTMGITAPSLYAAFGDKKALFLEAVSLYAGDDEQRARAFAEAQSAYAAASHLLMACAALYTGEATPSGCLLASSTATGSDMQADVRAAVARIRSHGRQALRSRIERDVATGMLPEGGGRGLPVRPDIRRHARHVRVGARRCVPRRTRSHRPPSDDGLAAGRRTGCQAGRPRRPHAPPSLKVSASGAPAAYASVRSRMGLNWAVALRSSSAGSAPPTMFTRAMPNTSRNSVTATISGRDG